MRPPREDTLPWYKQFWPWFLISLPLSVVIAAIVTINIAIESDDGLVSDDYYKEGLAIHKDADRAARAAALGIAGVLIYDAETGAVTLTLEQPLQGDAAALSLRVIHPTLPNQDQSIQLTPLDQAHFAGLGVNRNLGDLGSVAIGDVRVTDTGVGIVHGGRARTEGPLLDSGSLPGLPRLEGGFTG